MEDITNLRKQLREKEAELLQAQLALIETKISKLEQNHADQETRLRIVEIRTGALRNTGMAGFRRRRAQFDQRDHRAGRQAMTRAYDKAPKSVSGRTRGGQPGNKNNLRHGFYSELFTAEDSQRLDGEINILDDLKAMRIKAYRLFKLTTLKKIDEKEIRAFDCLARALQFINTARTNPPPRPRPRRRYRRHHHASTHGDEPR